MKIFNALTGAYRVGVTLTPIDDDTFCVQQEKKKIALVSRKSLDEMLRKGHAIETPEFAWRKVFGNHEGRSGEIVLLRCAYELNQDGLWLVPEVTESSDLLLFYEWRMTNSSVKPVAGMTLLNSVDSYNNVFKFMAIHLEAGGMLVQTFKRNVQLPNPGIVRLDRTYESKAIDVDEAVLELSADGKTLLF